MSSNALSEDQLKNMSVPELLGLVFKYFKYDEILTFLNNQEINLPDTAFQEELGIDPGSAQASPEFRPRGTKIEKKLKSKKKTKECMDKADEINISIGDRNITVSQMNAWKALNPDDLMEEVSKYLLTQVSNEELIGICITNHIIIGSKYKGKAKLNGNRVKNMLIHQGELLYTINDEENWNKENPFPKKPKKGAFYDFKRGLVNECAKVEVQNIIQFVNEYSTVDKECELYEEEPPTSEMAGLSVADSPQEDLSELREILALTTKKGTPATKIPVKYLSTVQKYIENAVADEDGKYIVDEDEDNIKVSALQAAAAKQGHAFGKRRKTVTLLKGALKGTLKAVKKGATKGAKKGAKKAKGAKGAHINRFKNAAKKCKGTKNYRNCMKTELKKKSAFGRRRMKSQDLCPKKSPYSLKVGTVRKGIDKCKWEVRKVGSKKVWRRKAVRKTRKTRKTTKKAANRKGPLISATKCAVGTVRKGVDRKKWVIKKYGKVKRWVRVK
jgi:hypothetical protein